MRSTQLGTCAKQGRLISEPDLPLADHAAFGNQCVVKKKKHPSICRSLPGHDISMVGECVCVPTTKKRILHDRLASIGRQIHSE